MSTLRAIASASVLIAGVASAQTPPNPPSPTPAPGPRFNSGSQLDGIRNQAWAKLEELKDAYEQCDPARYERALRELEQLRRDAKAAAAAARAAGGLSTIKPEEADGLVEALTGIIQPRAALLPRLQRECAREHKPGGIGSILGPARPPTQPAQPPAVTPAQPQCPQQPPTAPQAQPSPPVESILDEIEEMERWEREQRKAQKERQQQQQQAQGQPAQGLTSGDAQAIAAQQMAIDSFEADIALLKRLLKEGRIDEAHDLVDELDEWLDWLESRPNMFAPVRRPQIPKGMIDEWDRRIDDILDEFMKLPKRFNLDPTSSRILDLHNMARVSFGFAPLGWDRQLACQALAYGPTLAQAGQLVHSPRAGRETSRENLLQAPRGMPLDRMIGRWTSEQRDFVPGIFPDVSRSGNWMNVAHFTQMMWPTTSAVGCGLQRGTGSFDWLICRYAPPGNKDGRPIFAGNSGPVIADNSGIAPPTSATPTTPRPPPPPPTASDEAPGGNEDNHPLVGYGAEAFIRHSAAIDCGNQAGADAEIAKLRYALDELRKRLKAAKKAGQFSAVKPQDVQRQIDLLESFLRAAEQRRPRGACPTPPPPPPPPP